MGTGSGISVMRVRRPRVYNSTISRGQPSVLDKIVSLTDGPHDDYPEVKHQQEAMAI